MQISKPKIYMKKSCVSLRKDFLLDNKMFRFFFKFALNRRILIIVTLHIYLSYIWSMCIKVKNQFIKRFPSKTYSRR